MQASEGEERGGEWEKKRGESEHSMEFHLF
jgi:hypothetical protein